MDIGIVGLGRMGAGMTRRWMRAGHRVVGFNRSHGPIRELESEGMAPAYSVEALTEKLASPRAVWVMVPAGEATEAAVQSLLRVLQPGDAIVDGGNSDFRDSQRRHLACQGKGIDFVDQGTSGGVWGLREGFCLMIGGDEATFRRLEPAFRTLAPENGYIHAGPPGAGHFVKMVHNGIEYGIMQSYAEGFEILKGSGFPLDLRAVAGVWNHGSVIRSWLLELLGRALEENPGLEGVRGYVEDSGEGRWTVFEAINQSVPAPVIAASLFARFASRQPESFAAKVTAALRKQFGGHPIKKTGG